MSHFIQLSRRIEAIKATKKITHAMRLIAKTAYSRQRQKYNAIQLCGETIRKMLSNLMPTCSQWHSSILNPVDETNSRPLIIISSPTRGMCGSFRNNLIRYSAKKLQFKYFQSPTFVTIGKKALQIAQTSLGTRPDATPNTLIHFEQLLPNEILEAAQSITKAILSEERPFSQIVCLGSKFKNLFAQKPHMQVLTPIPRENIDTNATTESIKYLWEQTPSAILDTIARGYLSINISQVLFESLFAEYAARYIAMDNATTNAEDHIETLSKEYNKIRQTLVTREVAELSSAAHQ